MEKYKNIYESKLFVFAFSGLLGAIFFIFAYGTKILDPTYVDWMIEGYDASLHYLGWEMFRNSEWNWPIGLSSGMLYPFETSIVYSDSIPLFSIIFKAISPVLPANFQYFGFFTLLNYVLQGGFAGLILKKLTKDSALSIIGSLFFIFSSILTWRIMQFHTALGAHFFILAAIYACITKENKRSFRCNSLIWGGLLSASVSIHPYFVPMMLVPMCLYFADDIFEYKNIKKTMFEVATSFATLLVTMFLLGMFSASIAKEVGGFGIYSTNINSLINPSIGANTGLLSNFLKELPLSSVGQYEGYAYLGFGMLILVFIALFAFIYDYKTFFNKLSDKKIKWRVFLTCIFFFSFYVIALSNVVGFNGKVLFTYPLPGPIQVLMDSFRASGRLVWSCAYLIMILAICITVKKYKRKTAILIMMVLTGIQFYDMLGYVNVRGSFYKTKQNYETNLVSEAWEVIAQQYQHLFYTEDFDNRIPVLKFVADNNLTVNDTYLARKHHWDIRTYKLNTLEELRNGIVKSETVYFFPAPPAQIIKDGILYVYEIDGMIMGLPSPIESWENMQTVRFINPDEME